VEPCASQVASVRLFTFAWTGGDTSVFKVRLARVTEAPSASALLQPSFVARLDES
jgi:hypothetical protein